MPEEIYVSLTEEDFKELVNGQIIEKNAHRGTAVLMCLKNIGFERMLDIVDHAVLKRHVPG